MDEMRFEIALKGPREEAARALGEMQTILRDKGAQVARGGEPGTLDAGILIVILTHATVVACFEAIKSYVDRQKPTIHIRLTDEDLEMQLGDERLTKWIRAHASENSEG